LDMLTLRSRPARNGRRLLSLGGRRDANGGSPRRSPDGRSRRPRRGIRPATAPMASGHFRRH